MANKMGQLNCFTNSKNVGFGSCVLDWKQIIGAFVFDSPKTFTAAEIADLQDTLTNLATTDIKSNRMFPVHNFVAPVDNSEDLVVETFDYGGKSPVRDGDNDWTFRFVDGGACLSNSLRTHNGKKWVLFYDKDMKLMGYNKSGSFATIPTQFVYTKTFKLATGSTSSVYEIRFVFNSRYSNEESGFILAGFDLSEIDGLQDINIIVNTFNQNTGVANITLQLDCGADNIYDLYANQLVVNSFLAYKDDGTAVTITALTKVPGNKTFNITLNPAQLPDNTEVTLKGNLVSILKGQGIIGFEIDSVGIEIPGS